MNPILYPKGTTQFNTNGIGRIHCTRAVCIEERNGIYEVEFDVPITDTHYSEIQEGMIVACWHDETKTLQPFDIYKRSAPIGGVVTFYAHHISYRLAHTILEPFTASSVTQAFATFGYHSVTDNGFTFWTDKTTAGTFTVHVPVSIKEILGGVDGSILDVYGGGEYEWDGFTVKLHQNRGQDNGVRIVYGKNLTNLVHDYDISTVFNAVAPFWRSNNKDEEIVVTLPEHYVALNGVTEIIAVPLDLSGEFQEQPTIEQVRNRARKYLESTETKDPNENITVEFAQLWQTAGYENFAALQRVSLCDTVTVSYPDLGLTEVKKKVIRTEYNILAERYDRMELGTARTNFSEVMKAQIADAIMQRVPTITFLRNALKTATDLIKGGKGGHVVINTDADGHPNEILIMDTDNIQTAVNVIRMNMNGIAFSNSGYDPEAFVTAWTIDGGFNANFINSGSVTADILKGGIITDLKGKNYWNLTTGDISISLDPGEIEAVTTADLERIQNNAKAYANQAKLDAISEIETELEDYDTSTVINGKITANNQQLISQFSNTYVQKGMAVASHVNWYYNSASPTHLIGGEWTTTPPTWENANYIWERVQTNYADGTSEYSDPVCVQGKTGATGATGATGENALVGYVLPDSGVNVSKDESKTILLTAIVTDYTGEDLDPKGNIYHYQWFVKPDAKSERTLNAGKTKSIVVDANFCTDRALVWFEWADAFFLCAEDEMILMSEDGEYLLEME